jgi:hypothetical protein
VAERWKVSREAQDNSRFTATSARRDHSGEFSDEITPYLIEEHTPDLQRAR